MTDEEIRALLDGRAAPLSQESAVTRLQAAAPGLAREVLRLRRILAVEQGDESQAPEGWRPKTAIGIEWAHEGRSLLVMRGLRCWCWYDDNDDDKRGTAPTALEAMEAADRAARGEG